MDKRQARRLFLFHGGVILFAGLILLLGTRGSIQERLSLLAHFSGRTVSFLAKTAALFAAGYAALLLLLRLLRAGCERGGAQKPLRLAAGWILWGAAVALLVLKQWALDRFPLDEPEIVYYTLKNMGGGQVRAARIKA